MSKKKKKDNTTLRCELETYCNQGIPLYLDGKPSSPKAIVRAHCIAEEGSYMRDYVENEKGEVERLEFDLVKGK